MVAERIPLPGFRPLMHTKPQQLKTMKIVGLNYVLNVVTVAVSVCH